MHPPGAPQKSCRDPPKSVCVSPPPPRYWDTLLDILWPRFKYILELNIQSIQSTDPQKLGFLDTRPHYVWGG